MMENQRKDEMLASRVGNEDVQMFVQTCFVMMVAAEHGKGVEKLNRLVQEKLIPGMCFDHKESDWKSELELYYSFRDGYAVVTKDESEARPYLMRLEEVFETAGFSGCYGRWDDEIGDETSADDVISIQDVEKIGIFIAQPNDGDRVRFYGDHSGSGQCIFGDGKIFNCDEAMPMLSDSFEREKLALCSYQSDGYDDFNRQRDRAVADYYQECFMNKKQIVSATFSGERQQLIDSIMSNLMGKKIPIICYGLEKVIKDFSDFRDFLIAIESRLFDFHVLTEEGELLSDKPAITHIGSWVLDALINQSLEYNYMKRI